MFLWNLNFWCHTNVEFFLEHVGPLIVEKQLSSCQQKKACWFFFFFSLKLVYFPFLFIQYTFPFFPDSRDQIADKELNHVHVHAVIMPFYFFKQNVNRPPIMVMLCLVKTKSLKVKTSQHSYCVAKY